MKNLFALLLLFISLYCNAQPDNEPDSSIEIEIIVDGDVDSVLLFEFTDTTGVAHEVASDFGGHWRNGDFLCIYEDKLWDCETFYLIKGSVKFRRLTKINR